jgi:hypothetical protein
MSQLADAAGDPHRKIEARHPVGEIRVDLMSHSQRGMD